MSAFLQIIHVSDLHCLAGPDVPIRAADLRNKLLWLASKAKRLRRFGLDPIADQVDAAVQAIESGIAGHRDDVAQAAGDAIAGLVSKDPWDALPCWLVDTGDLTSLGDEPSYVEGEKLLEELRMRARPERFLSLRGNHDVWPETIPWHGRRGLRAHLANILPRHPRPWIRPPAPFPWTCQAPNGAEVQLSVLDTVLADAFYNTFAFGLVPPAALQGMVNDFASARTRAPTLRVLVTHHPIVYPDDPNPAPHLSMVLLHADKVQSLIWPPHQPRSVHLVLSGHVHRAHPEAGYARACWNATTPGQLVTGSLLQRGSSFAFEVLRFHTEPDPKLIRIERQIFESPGWGDFQPQIGPNGRPFEDLMISL